MPTGIQMHRPRGPVRTHSQADERTGSAASCNCLLFAPQGAQAISVVEERTAMMSNLDPILRRLAEWCERQKVVVNVLRAAALTGAAASLLEAGAAVFNPAGGLGPGGFAGS
ncbi:hypothetical protein AB0F52_26035 [Amycolatopsis sp. NPDC024027]|uniref:hypothetical protein n=1 Tax=Amycolatopsis sp. NPDC024027 TaxID=3154327 RepID=UPI0033FF0575